MNLFPQNVMVLWRTIILMNGNGVPNKILAVILPKLGDVLFAALLLGAVWIAPRMLNQDGDTGRHIAIGRTMIANLQIPRSDVFSHTMTGMPLTPHEWVAQTLFGLADRALGLAGVVWLVGVVFSATFLITYDQARKRSPLPLLALALTLLGVAAASLHLLARPHIFTLLFVSLWVIIMERVRLAQPMPVWAAALVMLVWANTHGAFVTGFVIWAAYLFESLWQSMQKKPIQFNLTARRYLVTGGLALMVTFINPAGVNLWKTVFEFLGSRFLVGHTQEYLPPDFHQTAAIPFLLMIGLSLFLLAVKRSTLPLSHGLLLAGWSVLGMYSARNIPIYAVIAVPILVQALGNDLLPPGWLKLEHRFKMLEESIKGNLWLWLSTMGVILVMVFSPALRAHSRYEAQIFPVEAVNWIETNPQDGRLFNYFPWGGYLLYRLYPEYQVFIDGQTDFYGEALTREYATVIGLGEGWQGVLARYKVDWVLMPVNKGLGSALLADGWNEVYRDTTSVILRRDY